MITNTNSDMSSFLEAIAADLDIPAHLHEDAVVKYTDIGEWLAKEDSELAQFEPDIFPQGSFRLGTMVRPVNESEEYDIDLVCHLKIKKENTTQKQLKERVGNRLKKREDIKDILSESRRCWVLDYPEPFHMDVLPVIPNVDQAPNGILLTDTDLRFWQFSNPIEYANWFKERMKVVLNVKRAAYAKRYEMRIEDVPDFAIKTPLQRLVQILKRHRDIYFKDNIQDRPISIIITTLAAKAYANQSDLLEALQDVTRQLHEHVEKRDNDEWWVENPVEKRENFAHKWNEYPGRKDAFFEWLKKVREDFVTKTHTTDLIKSASELAPILGKNPVMRAASSLGFEISSNVPMLLSSREPQVPGLASTLHCVAPPWPLNPTCSVKLKGTVFPGSPRSRVNWPLTNRAVPRNAWLKFEALTNASEPYEVRWQIVNTGSDATEAGDLRGNEFEESNGANKNIRWEVTNYRGTHLIEAFIIQYGICVARSHPLRVRIR